MSTAPARPSRADLLFDARHIRQSGIGTYLATELHHLEEVFAERALSLAVLVDPDKVPTLRPTTAVVTPQPIGASMYSLHEQQVWDRALKSVRPRAIWLPTYPFPLAWLRRRNRKTALFVTVHDLLHLQDHEITGQSWAHRRYARIMLGLDARFCSTVFTPSQATASSLLAATPSARVCVTPIPLDDGWFAPSPEHPAPVHGPFILYVGNTKWHKNLTLLLGAYTDVSGSIPHKLVIAGGGESVRTIDERVAALAEQLGDRVVITGRVDFETLRSLYADADLLVQPSLYEGVGLPPLEAMASHTAVLASDIAAQRETCGDGAEYFDPYDRKALSHLIQKYCQDEAARGELQQRGWARVTTRQSQIASRTAAELVSAKLGGRPS